MIPMGCKGRSTPELSSWARFGHTKSTNVFIITRRSCRAFNPHPKWSSAYFLFGHCLDTQGPRPPGCDIQEDETVQDSELALVEDRPKPLDGVRYEVGNCHLTTCNEGSIARPKSYGHEAASDKLDNARGEKNRVGYLALPIEHAEHFLYPMACEEQSDHQTHNCIEK